MAGLIWVFARRATANHWFGLSLGFTTVVFFLFSLGEFSPYSPAALAHHLPLFSSFRIPSRYTIAFLQFAALTLAWAFHSIVVRYGFPKAARIAVGVASLAASAHLISVNHANLKNVFVETPFDTSFHWMTGPRQIATDAESNPYTSGSPMLKALMADRSFYSCYEALQLARGADPSRPQVFDGNPSERVTDVEFSPNRFTFAVQDGQDAARVVLNQNWAAGWTTTAGELKVGLPTELSTVTVPAGRSGRYEFSYMPPGIFAGAALLVIAAFVTAIVWQRRSSPIFAAPRSQ